MAARLGLCGPFLGGAESWVEVGGEVLLLAWRHSRALFLLQEDPTRG